MVSAPPTLEARGFGLRRGQRWLLDDIHLVARAGELLVLVGPNGAGKSTLLHALAALINRRGGGQRGELRYGGRRLDDWCRRALARRRALLAQRNEGALALDGRDVILLGRTPHNNGRERAVDHEIALRAAARTGVTELLDRPLFQLSGGEQQRLHLARALAQIDDGGARGDDGEGAPPPVLLLDEPTTALDPVHQHRCLALARELAREGTIVVAVLHELELAARYADRLAVLAGGRLLGAGAPEALATDGTLERAFGLPIRAVPHPTEARPMLLVCPGC